MKNKIDELSKLKEKAKLGGGEERIKSQHEKGKLTAERELNYSLMKAALMKLICLLNIVLQILDWINSIFPEMVL
ncbi:MAG: hypothetical protein MZV64_69940 [Ignavibacteriales bacterium]|nr:hypothetical protein [Ignavibacteriales bacterium]